MRGRARRLGIKRRLCLDGDRRVRRSRLNNLRHGRRCTADARQHDSRVGQNFHHITFIQE